MFRRTKGRPRDAASGFTLLEVVVAISLVAIVAVAALPLLVGAVRAATSAKMNTQAKNLAQQRIEQMRNMPFRVEALNGGAVVDLLDRYYKDVKVPSPLVTDDPCASRSYVPVGGAVNAGEPAPPFYRCVIGAIPGYPEFSQTVAVQFLGAPGSNAVGVEGGPPLPVAPPSGYDSQVANLDPVVSKLIGVTLLTSWSESGSKAGTYRSYTQIADSLAPEQSISAGAHAVALRVSSVVKLSTGPTRLNLQAGVLDAKGSTYTGSTAAFSVTGAFAELGDTRVVGRAATGTAPPTVDDADFPASHAAGIGGNCEFACFGNSSVSNRKASSASGLPVVASAASPLGTTLLAGDVGTDPVAGFRYTNVPDLVTATRLGLVGPLVSSTAPDADGTYASATGHLGSTFTPRTVNSQASVKTGVVSVLPTTFASQGVVRVRLASATVSCATTTGSGTPSSAVTAPAPSVVVEYLPAGESAYAPLPADADLDDLWVGPTVASTLTLADYLAFNPVRGTGVATVEPDGRRGEASLDAALRLVTVPTRELSAGLADPDAAVTIELGVLGCSTQDKR